MKIPQSIETNKETVIKGDMTLCCGTIGENLLANRRTE